MDSHRCHLIFLMIAFPLVYHDGILKSDGGFYSFCIVGREAHQLT